MPSKLSFIDIPAEVRLMVYRHLFVSEFGGSIRPYTVLPLRNQLSAQFLRVCRVCHKEGSAVLYAENEFLLNRPGTTTYPTLDFLKYIGPRNRRLIRRLQIRDCSVAEWESFRPIKHFRLAFENLESLKLQFSMKFDLEALARIYRILRIERGPFQKLVRFYYTPMDCSLCSDDALEARFYSTAIKPAEHDIELDVAAEIRKLEKLKDSKENRKNLARNL